MLRCFHKQSSVPQICGWAVWNWDINLSPPVLKYRTWVKTNISCVWRSISFTVPESDELPKEMFCYCTATVPGTVLFIPGATSIPGIVMVASENLQGIHYPGFLRSRKINSCRKRSVNPWTRNPQFWFWHLLTVEPIYSSDREIRQHKKFVLSIEWKPRPTQITWPASWNHSAL